MKKLSKLDKIEYVIVAVVILVAAFAIGVGLDVIEIGEKGISIEAMIQKEPFVDNDSGQGSDKANIIILTHRVIESKMNKALSEVEALSTIQGDVTRIRVESLG